jgi:mRNA interferase ChpB
VLEAVSASLKPKGHGAPLTVVLPITNGSTFVKRIRFAVPISGIGTTGVVRCDQPQTIGLESRGARKVDTLPDEILAEVLARVAPIFA